MGQDTTVAKTQFQDELEHGRQLLELLLEKRRLLEKELAMQADPSRSFLLRKLIDDSNDSISRIEQEIKDLETKPQKPKDDFRPSKTDIPDTNQDFMPVWSVVKSQIRYVDASLVFQFVDAAEDVNIMLGFTTLFLGSTLSFATSLITAQTPTQTTLLGTSTAFSLLLTLIFLILTARAKNRAKETKKKLFVDESSSSNITGANAK